MTAVAAAALFAAGCATPSSARMAMPLAATSSPPHTASTPAKPTPAPTVTKTVTEAPPASSPAQSGAPQAPATPAAVPPSGSGLSDAVPASSSTPAPPPSSFTPPPCEFGVCVPWVWYKATRVINNNAMLPIPTFGESMDNNTPNKTTLTDTVSGTVTVGAKLGGNLSANPSAMGIAAGTAGIMPEVSAQVSITETKTVAVPVPAGDQGVIMFGVPAVEVAGKVLSRSVTGKITSTPMNAWVPLNPSVFGFNAYVTPLTGSGPRSELPVIPVPAG